MNIHFLALALNFTFNSLNEKKIDMMLHCCIYGVEERMHDTNSCGKKTIYRIHQNNRFYWQTIESKILWGFILLMKFTMQFIASLYLSNIQWNHEWLNFYLLVSWALENQSLLIDKVHVKKKYFIHPINSNSNTSSSAELSRFDQISFFCWANEAICIHSREIPLQR